jgi:hypothetical protein
MQSLIRATLVQRLNGSITLLRNSFNGREGKPNTTYIHSSTAQAMHCAKKKKKKAGKKGRRGTGGHLKYNVNYSEENVKKNNAHQSQHEFELSILRNRYSILQKVIEVYFETWEIQELYSMLRPIHHF